MTIKTRAKRSGSRVETVTLDGKRFVILSEDEYCRLSGEPPEPELPSPDAQGNYPAQEALKVSIAREIIRDRRKLGWTQAELARRAGIRHETLNRIERGKHSPSIATVEKIDRALSLAAADQPKAGRGKRAGKR